MKEYKHKMMKKSKKKKEEFIGFMSVCSETNP